jgi:hypothetical protein
MLVYFKKRKTLNNGNVGHFLFLPPFTVLINTKKSLADPFSLFLAFFPVQGTEKYRLYAYTIIIIMMITTLNSAFFQSNQAEKLPVSCRETEFHRDFHALNSRRNHPEQVYPSRF